MPKAILWSPLAENDLDSILEYLKLNWGKGVVFQFIAMIEMTIGQISKNSRQFPVIYKRKGVRKCVMSKQNSLFYREAKGIIHILRIYDNRQNPGNLKFE